MLVNEGLSIHAKNRRHSKPLEMCFKTFTLNLESIDDVFQNYSTLYFKTAFCIACFQAFFLSEEALDGKRCQKNASPTKSFAYNLVNWRVKRELILLLVALSHVRQM